MVFLQERTISLHTEYINKLKLEWSVIEKEYPSLVGVTAAEMVVKKKKGAPIEAIKLKCMIELHDIYFSSFSKHTFTQSNALRKCFGAESTLLNTLYRLGCGMDCGYLGIGIKRGEIFAFANKECEDVFMRGKPLMVIDMFEHAYFLDYGFDRSKYLLEAIKHLDLPLIDKYLSENLN